MRYQQPRPGGRAAFWRGRTSRRRHPRRNPRRPRRHPRHPAPRNAERTMPASVSPPPKLIFGTSTGLGHKHAAPLPSAPKRARRAWRRLAYLASSRLKLGDFVLEQRKLRVDVRHGANSGRCPPRAMPYPQSSCVFCSCVPFDSLREARLRHWIPASPRRENVLR